MKTFQNFLLTILLLSSSLVFGRAEFFSITPITDLPSQVTIGQTLTLQYRITNQSIGNLYYSLTGISSSQGLSVANGTTCAMKGLFDNRSSCILMLKFDSSKLPVGNYSNTIGVNYGAAFVPSYTLTTTVGTRPQETYTVGVTVAGLPVNANNVYVKLSNGTTNYQRLISNGSSSLVGVAGGTYTITATDYTDSSNNLYEPNITNGNSITVNSNTSNIQITYNQVANTLVPVTTNVTGLPNGIQVSVIMTDVQQDKSYTHNVSNGLASFDTMNAGAYQITAPSYNDGNGNIYSATLSVNPVNISQNNKNVSITYSVTHTPVVTSYPVILNLSGLPASTNTVEIKLINTNVTGTNYSHVLSNNSNISYDNVNAGTYQIVAPVYTDPTTNTLYLAQISALNPVAINQLTTLNITYSALPKSSSMWFAPYKDMTLNADWSDWQVGVKPNLPEIVKGSGATHFILAFLTQDSWAAGTCQPSWGGNSLATTPQLGIGFGLAAIQQIRAEGGDIAISFGGENGIPVEQVCGIDGFAAVMENVENTYAPAFIDFDVEGANLENTVANADRVGALKIFLQNHPTAKIQFTLPANNEGLAQNGINFLKQLLDSDTGLWAYRDNFQYNLMTMAWYSQKNPNGVEKSVEDAVAAGIQQINSVYCAEEQGTCTYQPQDFYKSIRVTPRIGVDYDGSIMQINEATTLVDYAKRVGLGGISFWSMDVDRNKNITGNCGVTSASAECSGVDQYPYEYTQTFLAEINKP